MKLLESGARPCMRVLIDGGWRITRYVTPVEKVMADFKRVETSGYVKQFLPWHPAAFQGWVSEHRVVAERKVGRFLRSGECVHHIDGNPANNDAENLVVFSSNAEHLRHHASLKKAA